MYSYKVLNFAYSKPSFLVGAVVILQYFFSRCKNLTRLLLHFQSFDGGVGVDIH